MDLPLATLVQSTVLEGPDMDLIREGGGWMKPPQRAPSLATVGISYCMTISRKTVGLLNVGKVTLAITTAFAASKTRREGGRAEVLVTVI